MRIVVTSSTHFLASERDTIRGVEIRAGAVYIYGCTCVNSNVCHIYEMWAELGHCHFSSGHFYNVVTTGNGH